LQPGKIVEAIVNLVTQVPAQHGEEPVKEHGYQIIEGRQLVSVTLMDSTTQWGWLPESTLAVAQTQNLDALMQLEAFTGYVEEVQPAVAAAP